LVLPDVIKASWFLKKSLFTTSGKKIKKEKYAVKYAWEAVDITVPLYSIQILHMKV